MTATKKAPIKTPTTAERLEQAIERAREAKAALEAAWIADKPTADLRTAHQAALEAVGEARAELEAERRAEAEAARQAEQQRIAPMVEAMVADALEPLKARIEQGFSIEAPGLPEVRTEWAVKSIWAREKLEAVEQAMTEAQSHAAKLDARIEGLHNDRAALIARRTEGDCRDDDAAALALIDADLGALTPLATEAHAEVSQVSRALAEAQKAHKFASESWEGVQRSIVAEFYEAASKRIESLLGDCFDEQRKGQVGYTYAPMLYDNRTRAAAHLKPLNVQEAA